MMTNKWTSGRRYTFLTPWQEEILKTKWLDWYIQNTREVQKKYPRKKNKELLQYLLNLKWENYDLLDK